LEEYPEQNMKFLEENKIKFLQFGIAGNKVNCRALGQWILSSMLTSRPNIGTFRAKYEHKNFDQTAVHSKEYHTKCHLLVVPENKISAALAAILG
jgi:hypothetical protein